MLQSSQLILNRSCQDQKLRRIQNIRIIMNYQTVRLVSTLGQAAAFPVLGQAQTWKLRPFPVLGLPKSGNCRRVSSFGPFPLLGLQNCFNKIISFKILVDYNITDRWIKRSFSLIVFET